MAVKLLVALDGSERSMKAIEHVNKVISKGCRCYVTLFHVSGIPADLLEHQGSVYPDHERQIERELKARRDAWEKKTQVEVESEIFEPARQKLLGEGDNEGTSRVFSRLEFEPHHRVASSILWESERGDYDAVVVGRHGHSHLQEFVLGSVSSKVIHHLKNCSVWVVE